MEMFITYADGASGRVALTRHDDLDSAIDHAEMLSGQHGLRYKSSAESTVKDRHAHANAVRIVVVGPDGKDLFTTHMRYR
jgi:hypothetical protein